jgi:hypothetical protein
VVAVRAKEGEVETTPKSYGTKWKSGPPTAALPG